MHEQALTEMVTPILERHGLELDALDVAPMGKRSLLRITVDGDGPAGRGPLLDDIAEATQSISKALDESTATGEQPYTLEVSSRGVSKPLTAPKHFRRNTGRLVKLWLGEGELVGRITQARDEVVFLDVDGTSREVLFADVRKAVVQVEMNRKEA